MTKKGMIIAVILAILLILITIIVIFQDNKPLKNTDTANVNQLNKVDEGETDIFSLDITEDTGLNLEELKSYSLPIIICVGSPEEEICNKMMPGIKLLNHETEGSAFVKYLDTDKYQALWKDERLDIGGKTIQILIDSEGKPFDTPASVAQGYSLIYDENGEHIYTIHEGDLTLTELRNLIAKMKIK